MKDNSVIGIDLGATNVRGAIVNGEQLSPVLSTQINNSGSVDDVLQDIYALTDKLLQSGKVEAIGIGVPSVVDVELGIVYDVQLIPSWQEVHLKDLMQRRYQLPVFVNNDANCFALGELYFGKGLNVGSMIGLTLGTGLGAGIIINQKLYSGINCGAGEFGCIDYLDRNFDYYSSGSFFQNIHGINGKQVYEQALQDDAGALALYQELGKHIGNAIKVVMYSFDPSLIVLGGSVSQGFQFFKDSMWEQVNTLAYPKSVERIKIETSALSHSGILGAAALYFDAKR